MELNVYKEEVKRSMAQLGHSLADQLHMAMGISTEASEILDVFKKKLAYGKEIDVVNVREEIGDIMWYIANLSTLLEIDLEEALQINVDKLKARYPDKFDEEKALNRDLETERSVLENNTEK